MGATSGCVATAALGTETAPLDVHGSYIVCNGTGKHGYTMFGHAGFHVSGATSALVAEILALDAALATLSLVL